MVYGRRRIYPKPENSNISLGVHSKEEGPGTGPERCMGLYKAAQHVFFNYRLGDIGCCLEDPALNQLANSFSLKFM